MAKRMTGETLQGSKRARQYAKGAPAKLVKKNQGFIDQSSDDEAQESLPSSSIPDSLDESTFQEDELLDLVETESDLLNISAVIDGVTQILEDVPPFKLPDEEDEEDDINFENGQKRGKSLEWILVSKFENAAEATEFITSENCWRRFRQHVTQEGKKDYFKCTISSKCPANFQALYCSENQDTLVFKSKEHNHTFNNFKRGIPTETKDKIEELFKLGIMKPKAILKALEETGLTVPTSSQLANHLVLLKNKLYGKISISLGELEEWAKTNDKVPEDEDEPFVCGFESHYDGPVESRYFRLALTTKRLLTNSQQSDLVQADATYKLIWQGFPVLIAGTTDLQRQFHPLCLAICSSETESDFCFLFKSLKNVVSKI